RRSEYRPALRRDDLRARGFRLRRRRRRLLRRARGSGVGMAAAVWFPRARSVELRTEALPEPGHDEVLVRAALSAISHGTEMLVYRGEVDADLALDLPTLVGGYGFPLKYGYASVGRAVAVGRDVDGLREGDLVFALHPHQDEYVVSGSPVRCLPDRTTPEQAVFLANLETATNVVLDAKP